MSQNLGSAYHTSALPFPSAGLPANISSDRRSFVAPGTTGGSASLRHSLYAATFMVAYLGIFFAAGYAALNIIDFKDCTRARLTLFNATSHYEAEGLALPAAPAARLSKWWSDVHEPV